MFIVLKLTLKETRGVRRDRLPMYLDEFMWCERYGRSTHDAFQKLWEQVAAKHPLP